MVPSYGHCLRFTNKPGEKGWLLRGEDILDEK